MEKINEIIEIKQVHDNDKYIVTRKTVEELTGADLVKIYEDMEKAHENIKIQKKDLSGQYDKRKEFLENEDKMLTSRKASFYRFVNKIKQTEKPKDSK